MTQESQKNSTKMIYIGLGIFIFLIIGCILALELNKEVSSDVFSSSNKKDESVFEGLPLEFPDTVKSPDEFRGHIQKFSDRILFGAFPYGESFEILQEKGVTQIVTLMSDYENRIADYEEQEAKKYGLSIDRIYLDYRVKEGDSAITEVKKIIENPKFKDDVIYFHCFLGDHRANFTKYYIAQLLDVELPSRQEEIFSLGNSDGEVIQIANNVFIGPEIRPESYLYALYGELDLIINLIDINEYSNKSRSVGNDQQFCDNYDLECVHLPVNLSNLANDENLSKVKELLDPNKRIYIHHLAVLDIESVLKKLVQ